MNIRTDVYGGDINSVFLRYKKSDFNYYSYGTQLNAAGCKKAFENVCDPSKHTGHVTGRIDMEKVSIMDDNTAKDILRDYNLNISDIGDKLIMMNVTTTLDENAFICATQELCKNEQKATRLQTIKTKQSGDYERWINTRQMYQMYKLNMVNLGIGIICASIFIYNQY